MPEQTNKWETASADDRASEIIHALVDIELEQKDPEFFKQNTAALNATAKTDRADWMRHDLMKMDRVRNLRAQGIMLPRETVFATANSMVDFNPDQMRAAFSQYAEQFTKDK